MPTLSDTLSDPKLLQPHFPSPDWDAWRAFCAALYGPPMMAEQLATIAPVRAARARPRLPRHRRGYAQVVETTIDRVLRDHDVRPLAGRRIEAMFQALAIEGSDGGPARVAARAVAHER